MLPNNVINSLIFSILSVRQTFHFEGLDAQEKS